MRQIRATAGGRAADRMKERITAIYGDSVYFRPNEVEVIEVCEVEVFEEAPLGQWRFLINETCEIYTIFAKKVSMQSYM